MNDSNADFKKSMDTLSDMMTPSPDEQTETDELRKLFNDHDLQTGVYGEHSGWMQNCETCKAFLESWSRKQTEQVLEELLKQKVKHEFYGWVINAHIVADKLAAIEAARARVRP